MPVDSALVPSDVGFLLVGVALGWLSLALALIIRRCIRQVRWLNMERRGGGDRRKVQESVAYFDAMWAGMDKED